MTNRQAIRQILWALALVGSMIGGLEFVAALQSANGALQQAAGAGMALAWAVLPYVFARSADEIIRLGVATSNVRGSETSP